MLLFFIYASVSSWLRIARYARFPHDAATIIGLTTVIFVTASITYRSPLSADRVVFGVATAAFVLMAVRMASLTPVAMSGVETAEAFMWTIAAATCLIALGRGLKTRRRQ
jgi:hypothetical protein